MTRENPWVRIEMAKRAVTVATFLAQEVGISEDAQTKLLEVKRELDKVAESIPETADAA